MYFSLYSLFLFFHIVLLMLLFSVIVTPFRELQEQIYANKFVLDHSVLLLLDKRLIFSTPAHKFMKKNFFKLKYVLLSY